MPETMTAQDKVREGPRRGLHEIAHEQVRDTNFTRSDHAAPGERPDSTRTATRLKLAHSFLGHVIIAIEYFCWLPYISIGFSRFYKPTDIHRCFDSGELTNCVPRSCLTITSNSLCIQYYLGILFGSCYIRIWFLIHFLLPL